MNIRKLIPRPVLSPLALVAIVALALFAVVAWILFATWQHDRRAAADARVTGAMGQARTAAGAEAGQIVDRAHAAETASEALSRENADAIRQARGADAPLDPELNDAGRRSLCRRAAYRGRPECAVQQPRP